MGRVWRTEATIDVKKITADDINMEGMEDMEDIEDIINTSLYPLPLLKTIMCNQLVPLSVILIMCNQLATDP